MKSMIRSMLGRLRGQSKPKPIERKYDGKIGFDMVALSAHDPIYQDMARHMNGLVQELHSAVVNEDYESVDKISDKLCTYNRYMENSLGQVDKARDYDDVQSALYHAVNGSRIEKMMQAEEIMVTRLGIPIENKDNRFETNRIVSLGA